MAPFLYSIINNYEDLVSQVERLQRMELSSLTPFTHPKFKRDGRKGDDAKATTSAAFVAQTDKEKKFTPKFRSKPTLGGGKEGQTLGKKNGVYSFR